MANLVSLTVNDTGYLRLPAGTTAQRPSSPTTGMMRYNTSANAEEYYDGTRWVLNGDMNLIDPSTWVSGTTGTQSGFGRNGATAENYLITGTGPFGTTTLWEARPESDNGSDGGWNGSQFPVDPQYKYRFSVWVNRTVQGNGHFYLGTRGYQNGTNIGCNLRSSGSGSTNPYFEVNASGWNQWSENGINVWYLVIGHLWPEYSGTGAADPESGVFKLDGTKLTGTDLQDWTMKPGTTHVIHRSYLYYSTNTTTRQQWAYPRVDRIDGSQPTIDELLAGRFAF